MHEEVAIAKTVLRKKIAKLLESIPEHQVQLESQLVYNKVLKKDWLKNARSISLYCSTKGEIITDGLIKHCLLANKNVFIPRFKKGARDMEMLRLNSLDEYNQLESTLWGIRQHPLDLVTDSLEQMENGQLDVIVMPGVAFSSSGHRLGHGKGFYDRFLHNYETKYGMLPKRVGLALLDQMVDEVPVESHDVNLDCVIHA